MIQRILRLPPIVRFASLVLVTCGALPLLGLLVASWYGAQPNGTSGDFKLTTVEATADSLVARVATSALVRIDTFLAPAGIGLIPVETLSVVADTNKFPSFRRYGYLNDEVRRFNSAQLWAARRAKQRADFDSIADNAATLWRLVHTGVSSRDLSLAASTAGDRRVSPFEETSPVAVVGVSSREALVLLSSRVVVPIDSVADIPLPDDRGNRSCQIRQPRPERGRRAQMLIYCRSSLGSDDGVQPQFRVESRGDRTLLTAGYESLRVDGRVVVPGDSIEVRAGALIEVPPIGTMMLTALRTNSIMLAQWIDGKRTRIDRSPLLLPFSVRPVFERSAEATMDVRTVPLTLDVALSEDLQSRLQARVRSRYLPVDFVSAVLADVSRGALLAVTEVRAPGQSGRIRSFEAGPSGSIVKPILAASILSRRPDLASLTTPATNGIVREIAGLPVKFSAAPHCRDVGNVVDLERFIRCSDNRYAATLLLTSLVPPGGNARMVLRNGLVPRPTILASPVATGLLSLFDQISDEEMSAVSGPRSAPWKGLKTTNGTGARVGVGLWPKHSSPTIVERSSPGTAPGLMAMYSIGGWLDRWSPLDLTEAFARLVSDTRITLTFVPSRSDESPPPLKLRNRSWYPTLMSGMRRVAEDGTASGLAKIVRDSLGKSITIWAKTGTLGEDEDQLFVRSLGFVIGEQGARGRVRCGIAGVVVFRFRERPGGDSVIPAEHLAWFREDLMTVLRRCQVIARACRSAEDKVPVGRRIGR